jgi:pimeloyl-ACP methyl ester carboxylesterase/DNA-binding winged helix-turn-helix (wHTH) protein
MIYAFADYELDTSAYELRRGGAVVPVEPQVFDVLAHLVRHHDRVVHKDELLDGVWGTRFVTESALTSRIRDARRAVDDDGTRQEVIRTAHGRGYRFVAEVTEIADGAEAPEVATAAPPGVDRQRLQQEIRFCTSSDGVRLAYATVGDGPPLVKASNWLTHVDYEWESPVWRHWLEDLSRHHRLIRYDQRGCGLSDWEVDDLSGEARVRDLETVVDALGLERFPLLGISQGGAIAIEYAVRHPERVSRLVLYGAFAQGRLVQAATDEERRRVELQVELARLGWGQDDPAFRQVFTAQFMPEGSKELWNAFNVLQRRTTSPENAARIMEVSNAIDVVDLARQVRVPTLILHARDDRRPPFEQGRVLATLIPGSRFVALESCNHILLADEPAWPRFLEEVEAFLAEPDDGTT